MLKTIALSTIKNSLLDFGVYSIITSTEYDVFIPSVASTDYGSFLDCFLPYIKLISTNLFRSIRNDSNYHIYIIGYNFLRSMSYYSTYDIFENYVYKNGPNFQKILYTRIAASAISSGLVCIFSKRKMFCMQESILLSITLNVTAEVIKTFYEKWDEGGSEYFYKSKTFNIFAVPIIVAHFITVPFVVDVAKRFIHFYLFK